MSYIPWLTMVIYKYVGIVVVIARYKGCVNAEKHKKISSFLFVTCQKYHLLVDDMIHYMRHSMGMYGWPLHVFSNLACGLCQLASRTWYAYNLTCCSYIPIISCERLGKSWTAYIFGCEFAAQLRANSCGQHPGLG